MTEYKKCCTCKQFKSISEFYRDKTTIDGFSRRCKECKNEYIIKNIDKIKVKRKLYCKNNKEKKSKCYKEYYQKNRLKMVERVVKWNKENPEKYKKNKKKWNLKHPEVQKKSQKKWYLNNKEKVLKKNKKWVQENKENLRNYKKQYYQINLEKMRKYHKEWNKKHSNPQTRLNNNMSISVWKALKNKKGGRSWKVLVGYTLSDLINHLESQFDKYMNWNNYGLYWWIDHIKPKSLFHYTSPEEPEFQECWALENLQPMEKIENMKKGNKYEKICS